MTQARRLATGVFSSWSAFSVAALTSLIMTPLIVGRLGRDAYGLWSIYMSITGYFTLLDFGVSPAIVRFTSRARALGDVDGERRILSTALTFFVAAGAFVALGTTAATLYYEALFPPSAGVPVDLARRTFFLVGLDFALTLPFAVLQGVLLGHQRYLALNGINILLRLSRFALVLILLEPGPPGMIVLAAILLGTGLLRDLAFVGFTRDAMRGRLSLRALSRNALREVLQYSLPAFVIAIGFRLISYTDSLVIGYVLGVGAVTDFALAASLVDYVQEAGWGLAGVLVPAASELEAKGEWEAIRKRYLQFSRYCLWLMCPIMALSVVLGPSFFIKWVGPDHPDSAPLLVALMGSMAFYVVNMPSQAVLKGISQHRGLAFLLGLEAATNLVLSLVLARQWGVMGVAFGTLIPRALFTGVIQPAVCLRRIDLKFERVWLEVLRPSSTVVLGTCALTFAAAGAINGRALGWLEMVIIGIGFGAILGAFIAQIGLTPEERKWVAGQVNQRLGRSR